ncbi:fibrocystin-L [Aplysia californica]|uniref:Fibrocystin-L n=1 Tax=Aplysia californica TaxID=6500 RepID=A0ABM1A818_APLCA|nr:fibrocystin-L [Aplysia californica]
MKHRLKLQWQAVVLYVLLWAPSVTWAAVPEVNSLTPQCGSLNGGTRITVYGKNFARNFFNFGAGNENLGSRVRLSGLVSHDCDLHPDGSHETQIMCYTQPMAAGQYDVKVSVDGEDVLDSKYCSNEDDCKFTVSDGCTPTIDSIKPTSGMPGAFLEITGNIITTKYGSNEPDETQDIILRVYFGGQKCELRDEENDQMYGISLDNDRGYMKCKTEGTYIGNHEISFLVSNEYGRSLPHGQVKHVRSNGISPYQTYTEITGLSQSSGSTVGGTRLTISGQHFDETDAPVSVIVGESNCDVVGSITDTEIVCSTPAEVTGISHFAGSRGFYVYMENGTTDASSINRNTAAIQHVDQSRWEASNWPDHAIQMVGFFVPIYSGPYKFCVKAKSTAQVYLSTDENPNNKALILTDSGDSCTGKETAERSLTAGQKYYTEIHYGSSDADSYVALVAHLMETSITEEDTGMAEHEVQDLKFTSEVTQEILTFTVSSSGTPSSTQEDIQELTLTGNPSAYVVLTFEGASTKPMTLDSLTSGKDVASELMELPTIPFKVDVQLTSSTSGPNHVVTLSISSRSPQGAIGEYGGQVVGGAQSGVTFSVTRRQSGVPTLESFVVTMEGVPSSPIDVGASARNVKSALEDMFSVRCHPLLSSGATVVDYEEANQGPYDRTSDVEPFCGRYSAKNPGWIYHKGNGDDDVGVPVSTSNNRYLCLAYMGLGKVSRVNVVFDYKNIDNDDAVGGVNFNVDDSTPDVWKYHCEDIHDLISNSIVGTGIIVNYIRTFRQDGAEDLYIDQVMFLRAPLMDDAAWDGIALMRTAQATPNGAYIDKVEVSETASNTYEVKLFPHHCGFDFPLPEIAAATKSGSTYRITNGGNVGVTIARTQTASPPIAGTYKVTFDGDTSPAHIPVTTELDSDAVVSNLMAMRVGFAEVTESGSCSEFTYRVKMLSHTGNQPLMTVDKTRLTGTNVDATVDTVVDGGVWFDPIMGDLLRTYHTSAQVTAFINNVPTSCLDDQTCQYAWSSGLTPTLSSINPTSGSMGAVVTISGSGFDGATLSNNEVIIGATPCTVTGATTSQITCTLNNGPTGDANVAVTVVGKGLASGTLSFAYVTGVTGFTSAPGSVEGGTTLTITGFGFTPDAEVKVDNSDCTILTSGESEITCRTPRAASHTSSQTVDVTVVQAGSSEVAGQFTYDPSLPYTPVITAISRTTSEVWGGSTITIDGQGFGNTEMPVTLGGVAMVVSGYTDTQIEATLPALSHGSYMLRVDVQNNGYADLRQNSISDITYTFEVTSMTPDFGSLYGGTDLLITGTGFNTNSSLMDVSVGPHKCDISSATLTSIECRIADTGVTHTISATGTHVNYGIGYAWDKDPHTVNVGDYVTWTWSTPTYVSDIGYGVHQTERAGDLFSLEGGFSSGEKTRVGSFTHRFTVPGTYPYWTGFMDSAMTIFFRGTINVVALESHAQVLSVSQLGEEAHYDTAGTVVSASPACSSVTDAITGCTDSTSLSAPPSGKFGFSFLKCYSPSITAISLSNGTYLDTVTFTGEGFGTDDCQNEVIFADSAACETVISSETSIGFRIATTNTPAVGVLQEFNTRVANLGYALVALQKVSDRRFGLLPKVESILPFEGSKVGGTKITLSGGGFSGTTSDVTVEFDYMSCIVESVSYTEIVCETICGAAASSCYVGAMSPTVLISTASGDVAAECSGSSCRFITSEANTATVTDITPTTVSAASTTITITGTSFSSSVPDTKVKIGGEDCVVASATGGTEIICTVGRLPVGDNSVDVYVENKGKAAVDTMITSQAVASVSLPAESSENGGAELVINGNGFVDGSTTVTVGGADCPVTSVNFGRVRCTLPALAAGAATVAIRSNNVDYTSLSLTYSAAATPSVDDVSPTGGRSGDTVTITGTAFTSPAATNPTVKIGGVDCAVTGATDTSITCTAGTLETGAFAVQVFVPQLGFSNDDVEFTYEVGTFSINPNTGTTNGGQVVTLTGSGFLANETSVTICGAACTEVSVSASQYTCITPQQADGPCDVVATVKTVSQTNANAYTFDSALESTVTGVSPTRGGTGGGTLITITGTNFGSNTADIAVEIAGAACSVQTVEDTKITCRTGSASSAAAQVEVQRNGWGLAQQISANYEYIDLWSSPYTWGAAPPPVEGDFVVIPKGMKLLLDNSTEVLKMLLIQGGELIFDEADIELQAENILITDGGLLQAGTAARPFPSAYKAIITMHGHLRSKELPIYGTKTLAVREGTLDLYGTPVAYTWTRLAATAAAGATTITLEQEVDWQAGDEIVIATTGHRHSQKESEVRTIHSVSGYDVILTEALEYEHLGIDGTFGSHTVQFRAEVGHFTRNVMVRGYRNTEFDTQIEACPAGFNTGEFATQTCFQGRFGEELGSDQFGAQIMVHQVEKDTQIAQAHLSYVELRHSGQAFRMGRYPIHFHLNGIMDQSFVRGCSIHTSFNRAVNVHGSHNILIEHNVIYNVMGGSFFLEDGDEIGNIFQYNLAVFVRSSTSLRNDDITPAAFWATNPNNTFRHNAAAGGTHFGTWYRMHTNPEGPGFDPNICPQAYPLGEYSNNTAHSLGWFGLWIFETYIPRVDASCSSSADHLVAKFYSLTAWNCEKGAEGVNSGALQFRNFVLVNNEKAGYEGKLLVGNPPQYDENNGPGVFDSVIVAHYDNNLKGGATARGVVIPYQPGFLLKNIEFYNFDQPSLATIGWARIDGTCGFLCGGFTTETAELQFINSPYKVFFEWESEGVLHDRDGTLAGSPDYSVAAWTDSFDNTLCTLDREMSVGIPGCICTDQIKLIRFAFNNIVPESLMAKDAVFTSEFGTSNSRFADKRITHPDGWSMVLMVNTYYNFSFENAEHVTNISYDSAFYRFDVGDFIVFTQFANLKPDLFMLDGSTALNMSDNMLSGNGVIHGDWYYSTPDQSITYAVQRLSRRKKRGAGGVSLTDMDLKIDTRIIRCYYRGCKPPPKPMELRDLPSHIEYWSDLNTWVNFTSDGLPPEDYDNLTIPIDKYIIVDVPIPKLSHVIVDGGLEFSENNTADILLEADYIQITGRVIAGWATDRPYTGNLIIRLRGNHQSPVYPTNGVPLGSKFIGVFGGLQLHGVDKGLTKTHLAETVDSGNEIKVVDAVSWAVGDDILLTTTDYNPWHSEVFKITAISGTTITLNSTIQHRHISHTETINGQDIHLRAVVAVLTRNIRIEGEEYPDMISESFGARVIVGQNLIGTEQHSGFAQISNVEFYHTGQEGFSQNYDPRFSLTYMDVTSTEGEIRYSYVKKSTFHSGFNTAIGAFAVDGLEIDDNVVYHTVGQGIRTEATGTKITNNLVALSIWTGTYLDRYEPINMEYPGAIDGLLATDLVLVNNTVAGAERFAYSLGGQSCSTLDADLWSGNMAQGALLGVGLFSEDPPADSSCTTYSGFTLWKNLDFGIYYNSVPSAVFKNNIFVENGVGIFPFVMGPASLSHAYQDKYSEVSNNIFIGKTSTFSESLDVLDKSDHNIQLSVMARSHGSGSACGKIGMEMTIFTSGPNGIPSHPLVGIMSYQTLKGITRVTGNTFANWGACTGGYDHAISTSKGNDDGNHPLHITSTTLVNTEMEAKVFFHPPNVGKINSADCVDMDCDGLKKCMIKDLDGTFLGHNGTILPDSAYEWDGDRRHGLGDYRIPSVMLTTSNGQKIDVNSYAPNKGIYKTDNCTWVSEWRAYNCEDFYDWRMLVIESMDSDTETRRLSPLAIYNPEGYVDLINGPQDHGWCSGYTCRKRLSTFQAIVALDQPFDMFLSSSNPRKMRYMLLNSQPDECVRLGMHYLNQNRLQVYVDGVLKMPTNGYIDGNGRFRLRLQNTNHMWMPDVRNKVNGENYLSRAESMIFWVVCGDSEVLVDTEDVFLVSFALPAMTDAEFFGEKIVENLAGFLNMDPSKVRIVNIVEDTSTSGRRKRQATGTTTFYVEIGDKPGDTPTVDYETVGKQICNQAQLYTFDDIINATVLYVSVLEPSVATENEGVMTPLQKTGLLVLDTHPVGDVTEGQLFSTQPKLKVTDDNNEVVTYLGSVTGPWEIEVSIKSGGSPYSRLIGNTSVTFQNGWANFTNLAITNRGDYILEFNVTSPPEATNYSLEAMAIRVNGRNLRPKAELKTLSRISGRPLELDITLEDKDTLVDITDIQWANHTWSATASVYDSKFYSGSLAGALTVPFDPATGKATFLDLQLDTPGKCPVLVTITSDPPDYTEGVVVLMDVMTLAQSTIVVQETHDLEVKFDIDFDEARAPYYTAIVRNKFSQNPDLVITEDAYRKGSLIITLSVQGTVTGYNDTLTSLCDDIANSTTFTFDNVTVTMAGYLTVDGQTYYGLYCGPIATNPGSSASDDGLETVYIVIIVILCIVVAALVAVLLAYKFYFHPKAKTSSSTSGAHYLGQNLRSDLLSDTLSKEDTFTSLKSRPYSPPMAPVGTAMPAKMAFDLHIETPGREHISSSPVPRMITPQPTPQLSKILEQQSSVPPPNLSDQPKWNF